MRDVDGGRAPERTALAVLLGGLATFQAALAAGAPWGELAWGGAHPEVVPGSLRVASAVSCAAWGAAAVAVASDRPRHPGARRTLLRGVAVVSGVGAAVNLASPSLPERLLWVPVASGISVLAWRLAGRAREVTAASAARAG